LELALHGFTAHLIDAVIICGVVDVGLFRRVDHADITRAVDEEAEFLEICWERRVWLQGILYAAEHSGIGAGVIVGR